MDANIRTLLASAQKLGGSKEGIAHLQHAYNLMRNVAETKPAVDAPESFSQDLFVICAEIAFQLGQADMSKECLKMYFMKTPPANQFLCRAYLCQSQLLAPTSAENPDQLDKAVIYLVKAISFAKENPRYHFLVYNASVLYWQFCRPFLKPNYRRYLAQSLHQVVKALDDIDDQDFEWRAQLMIALIECHIDAGRQSDASMVASAAATFIRQNVPGLFKELFGLAIKHQLVETVKFHKDIKASPELSIYYRIIRLKLNVENKDPDVDSALELRKILSLCMGKDDRLISADTKSGKRPITPKKDREDSGGRRSPKSRSGTARAQTPTSLKMISADSVEKPYLLLELARLCLQLNQAELAEQCVEHMKACVAKDQGFYLETEFVECDLMVKKLGDKQETYQKATVEIRLQAIKRCEEALMNALRLGNPNVIQAGCVTQWNLCLPLLQPNLRQHVRKPLTLVATSLEDIQSLLVLLRCQIHTELAKCEEDEEQIEVAMGHLRKALSLDDGNIYRERLEVTLHRLQLRAELYKQPERPEDQAAMIIEQARKSETGTIRMKRSLLVKAGQALAPDAFLLVLDSESETKEVTESKGVLTVFKKLAGKANNFNNCVKKASGHLKRLGDENDRERARLWGDLAKVARKQEVWDVCRVASRFCLLYDDGRWKIPEEVESPRRPIRSKSEVKAVAEGQEETGGDATPQPPKTPVSRPASQPSDAGSLLYDRDLVRMLGEVNFIMGEALIHLLRTEHVELGDKPIPPEDKSKRPKGYVPKKPEEDEDWIAYCDWIEELSKDATDHFLKSVQHGIQLKEPWVVCSAAAYVWNYNNHRLTQNRHNEIVDNLQTVLDGLKKIGHDSETILLVYICCALAYGLIKPWLPPPPPKEAVLPPQPQIMKSADDGGKKSAKKSRPPPTAAAMAAAKGKPIPQVTISPDAAPDLKKAMEVIQYAMDVTKGNVAADIVPIAVRYPLIQLWVQIKQLQQQSIPKSLGTEDENNFDGQRPMTRAQVALEMLSLSSNGIFEFKDAAPLAEVVGMVENCKWPDRLIELVIWTRLALLAHEIKDHKHVIKCAKKAMAFEKIGTQPKGRKLDMHKYMLEQEMLAYASSILGQSYIENMAGKNSVRREAMNCFFLSARFACNASNYDLVLVAAKHYWNASLPLVSQPIERELIKEPLSSVLQCLSLTTGDRGKERERQELEMEKEKREREKNAEKMADGGDNVTPMVPGGAADVSATGAEVVPAKEASQVSGSVFGGPEDDLTLRAAMYGVLFQSYADKGEYEAGLKAMDQAVMDMPRTKHRLLIFKHRVIMKAKLGRNVNMDIQKFKDESEDYVAHMWRKVALCSKEELDQLACYQQAIEALSSESSDWQKIDCLIEFGQWLYVNEFPLPDAIDQLQWATDILLNMKFEEVMSKREALPVKDVSKGGKGGKKGGAGAGASTPGGKKKKTPPASAKGAKQVAKQAPAQKKDTTAPSISSKSEKESEGEINEADYVPVQKEVVIGVLPSNPNLNIKDLSDVQQLEALMRVNVLLAQVSGRSGAEHADYCIMAYGYIIRIWEVSLASSGPIAKEIAKAGGVDKDRGSAKGGKNKKPDLKDTIKEKPKRKGPPDAMPLSQEEWALYDVPDEVIEAMKHESIKGAGINIKTINKPTLTLYYMDQLVSQLREIGYSQLCLPILALMDMITRGILENRALNALVHFKAMEVCYELSLATAAEFHERLAGPPGLNEEELAKSREEIAIWNERLAQVAKEETKIKEQMEKAKEEKKDALNVKLKSLQLEKKSELDPVVKDEMQAQHLGKMMGNVMIRDVWTDTAEVLIRQGYLQPARDLLNEALNSAKAFEDKTLIARILFLFGRLSYSEAQYGQAVNFCHEAQLTHEWDEMFWYRTTMLMIDATQAEYSNRNRFREARNMLVQALNIFSEVAEDRPNKETITGYIMAELEAKLGEVQVSITKSSYSDVTKPKVTKALLSACQKFQHSSDKLLMLGYRREAVAIQKKHSEVLWSMARQYQDKEIKHGYYLQALDVLRAAVAEADDITQNAQSLTVLMELKMVNLPVEREAADLKQTMCELMLDMFELYATEERQRQVEEMRKGSVQKMVEEMVRQTPTLTDTQREWTETTKILADSVYNQLISAYSLVRSIPYLKTRNMFLLGRCCRLLAQHISPDAPSQWDFDNMNISKLAKMLEEGGGEEEGGQMEGGEEEEEDTTSKQYIKNQQAIMDAKTSQTRSGAFMAQAVECLSQAVNLALNKGYRDLTGQASLQLVECYGQFDSFFSSQYLALYQSCVASQHLEQILEKAQPDPVESRQAALQHQKRLLLKDNVTSNTECGTVFKTITNSLDKDWESFKNLTIDPNHLDMLREFPPHFNIVIMQHSPDKQHMYCAILDKSKNMPMPLADGKKKEGKQPQVPLTSKAKVIRCDTDPKVLSSLVERFKQHKHDVMYVLLKQEYQRTAEAQRKKMLENLDDTMKNKGEENNEVYEEWAEDESKLQQEFESLVQELEDYMRPLTQQMDVVFRPPTATSNSQHSKDGKDKDKDKAGAAGSVQENTDAVILLADPDLLELPLEALEAMQLESVVSLTRDFSLQMIAHRLHQEQLDEAALKAKQAAEKTKPPSRIPGLRDASKKQAKIIPLERSIPAGYMGVDTNNFRFMVDPKNDCAETEEFGPMDVFNQVMNLYSQQFTTRWLGVMGNEHIPSPAEWEIYLTEGTGFIFYGMEKFIDYIAPSKLTALNIPECMMVFLFDLANTSKSFLTQSKIDINKSATTLSLEKPVETAMLVSLTGVKSIYTNQWNCTLKENADRMNDLMKDILEKGYPSGQAVRYLFAPHRRPVEVIEGEENADQGQAPQEQLDQGGQSYAQGENPGMEGQTEGGDESMKETENQDQKEKEPSEPEEPVLNRNWYNMVCYGLPNLIVTQM